MTITLQKIIALSQQKRNEDAKRRSKIAMEIEYDSIMLFKYSADYLIYDLGFTAEWCCMMGKRALENGKEDAIKTIQKYWKECYYNPSYIICKNRLHRQFVEDM